MGEKYKLLKDDAIKVDGHTLYRIKALKNFGYIVAGELGGYVEDEDNLAQDGICWVHNYAKVYENAFVCDDAEIFNNARVYGHVCVSENASVCGNAKVREFASVSGNAHIYDDVDVFGNANVYDNATIRNSANIHGYAGICSNAGVCGQANIYGQAMVRGIVYDNAEISGIARISGNAKVHGDARVSGNAILKHNSDISNDALILSSHDYCTVSGFGSMARTTTFFKCKDGSIKVNCGCYNGTLDEFRARVKEIHGSNNYARGYLSLADTIEIQLHGVDELG